ncbi:MAG: Sec-independent protein translocase protein TatB [Burkholderiaceae bacterium]
MFDFGFSEMVVVAVIGLIVLGPERLPRVARQVGQWLGKLQHYVADVKSDINRQMELDELRRLQKEVTGAANDLQNSLQSTLDETRSQLDSISSALSTAGTDNEAPTDWDSIYAHRRARERIRDRRVDRDKELGRKRPKRRFR